MIVVRVYWAEQARPSPKCIFNDMEVDFPSALDFSNACEGTEVLKGLILQTRWTTREEGYGMGVKAVTRRRLTTFRGEAVVRIEEPDVTFVDEN